MYNVNFSVWNIFVNEWTLFHLLFNEADEVKCLLLTVTDEELIRAYFARFDESFFQFCDAELRKINTFFSGKLTNYLQLHIFKYIYRYLIFLTMWPIVIT